MTCSGSAPALATGCPAAFERSRSASCSSYTRSVPKHTSALRHCQSLLRLRSAPTAAMLPRRAAQASNQTLALASMPAGQHSRRHQPSRKTCQGCVKEYPIRFFPVNNRPAESQQSYCYGCNYERHLAEKPYRRLNEHEHPATSEARRCRDCDTTLPASFFKLAPKVYGGRGRTCSACVGERQQRRRQKTYNVIDVHNAGPKMCRRCRKEKPAAAFTRDKRSRSGLRPRCKECERQAQLLRQLLASLAAKPARMRAVLLAAQTAAVLWLRSALQTGRR